MGILTEEMKELVKERRPGYVATASKGGTPNVSARGSVRVIDDNTLGFACFWPGKTVNNLEENPNIAIAVADLETMKGFQFKGKAMIERDGPFFDAIKAEYSERKLAPQCVVKVAVTEVHSLPPKA